MNLLLKKKKLAPTGFCVVAFVVVVVTAAAAIVAATVIVVVVVKWVYLDIRHGLEYRTKYAKLLFWHSKWRLVSKNLSQNAVLIIQLDSNIDKRKSKCYFNIQAGFEYQ